MMPGGITQLSHPIVVSFRTFVLIFQKRAQSPGISSLSAFS